VVKHQFGKNIAQFEKAYASEIHDHLIDVNNGTVMSFLIHEYGKLSKTHVKTTILIFRITPYTFTVRKKNKQVRSQPFFKHEYNFGMH
jgi:hypothetical protein